MLTPRQRDLLERLYLEHHERLTRYCQQFGEHGEDAAATTWAIVTRHPERLRPDTPAAYLETVARREAWRLMRRGAPRGQEAPGQLHDELVAGDAPSVEDQAADHGLARDMLDAVGHLSTGQQIALIGRIVGLSYDEIGKAAGHPTTDASRGANTWANRHVTEGRKQLRDQLQASRWDR